MLPARGTPRRPRPLAVVAFRGSEHSYDAGPRWLTLHETSADDAYWLGEQLEDDGATAFLRFEDDDGEVRHIRRRDVAFVDVAEVDVEGEEMEAYFVAERSAA